MAVTISNPPPNELDPADARVLDDLAGLDARVAADEEAQRVASEVAADIQALLAHAISTGDVASLEAMRGQLNVVSFDEAVSIARRRSTTR